MGQATIETALNELKHAFFCQLVFAGQIIFDKVFVYDTGGLCRIFVQKRETWTGFFKPPLNKPRPRPAELGVVSHGGHGHTAAMKLPLLQVPPPTGLTTRRAICRA